MRRCKNLKYYVPRDEYKSQLAPVGFSLSPDGNVCHFNRNGTKNYSKLFRKVTEWYYKEVTEEEFVLMF